MTSWSNLTEVQLPEQEKGKRDKRKKGRHLELAEENRNRTKQISKYTKKERVTDEASVGPTNLPSH